MREKKRGQSLSWVRGQALEGELEVERMKQRRDEKVGERGRVVYVVGVDSTTISIQFLSF